MSTPTMSSPGPSEPSEVQQKIKLKVTVVRATGLPKVEGVHFTRQRNGKFYCVVTMGEERKETKVARRSSVPEWNQLLIFDIHPTSTLRIEIFARRKMRTDLHIGSISEPISVICPSMLEGGAQDITKTVSGESGARIVLRIGIEVEDRIAQGHSPTESLEVPPNDPTSQEIGQEMPTDAIPGTLLSDKLANLGRDIPQMRLLPQPLSTVVEGASSAPLEVGDFVATWKPLFDNIKIFGDLMGSLAEVHPYAKMAWSILSLPLKIVEKQMERDQNILKLFETMNSLYSIINVLEKELKDEREKIESQQGLFERIAKQTTECYYFIREYVNTERFVRRTVKHAISSTDDTIDAFCKVFVELEKSFHTGVAVQTEIVAIRILDKVEHILDGVEHILDDTEKIRMESDLKEIEYTPGASFDPNKGCQAGTRKAILNEIADWINSEDTHRVLLLSGAAGTGKSAIAHSIAQQFNALGRLGSSFCFTRAEAKRGPGKLFPTMACDLADFDQRIRRALWKNVRDKRSVRTTSQVALQFKSFILEPIKELTLTGPLVIVIDALDESGDAESRQALLQELAVQTNALPANVRILLTSRPEKDIEGLFQANDYVLVKRMQDISMTSTEVDITTFIHDRLNGPVYGGIDDARKSILVSKCEGLFQWASVACTFIIGLGITGSDPMERYNLLIEGKVHEMAGLDALYTTVLSHLFPIQKSAALEKLIMGRFRSIMALLLTTFEPVSLESLNEICRSVQDDAASLQPENILGGMGSVLRGVTEEEPIRPWHTSFRDFLLDPSRSGRYHVDISQTHRYLTLASLRIMEKQLVFNICHLESSYILNEDILDLADRVQESIPAHLSYSCRFWANHLQAIETGITSDLKLLNSIEVLLKEKFLFWLEVMSLLGTISGAALAVASVVKWTSGQHTSQLSKLASDAYAFMNVFGFPISQSTPHIYLSALAFAPQNSVLFERFGKDFPQVLKISDGADNDWPTAQHSIHAGSSIQCVAISPDGLCIVSGLDDSTIRVWDVSTGDAVGDPLKGHTNRVNSVAFSPDGKLIVSGSHDRTIRVWDAVTHAAVGEPLKGHTGRVNSVAFSPDGSQIVSGSHDRRLRVWDAATHAAVGEPLVGHAGPIYSVAFSPDGSRIVSGSYDHTIRMWDTATHSAIGDPIEGHTHQVNSVAFSPDGKWIVSGSHDSTIRVWDVVTHAAVGDPLEGYIPHVISVAFSPDGMRIVSGWDDSTIRVYDSVSHAAVGDPLEGHAHMVTSVSFLPDGLRIVSGSSDETIRVWDTATHVAVSDPLAGHSDDVNSVAFSPDGLQIVSGLWDTTFRVWDVATRAAVGDPLEGHTGPVSSVAFSPDGKRIVSGSHDKTIRFWDMATSAAVGDSLEGHTELVTSVTFSPDGKRIVSGSLDTTIRVWDAATHTSVGDPLKEHTGSVKSVAFSPDGKRIVSGSDDHTIRVWDAATRAAVSDPLEGHTGPVSSVAFSPDGKRIVSGSYDKTIRVWNAATREAVGDPLERHTDAVSSVAFSPDGKRIVSGSYDKTIRVWDTATHAAVGNPLEGHTATVTSVAFLPDGKRILSGSWDHTIRVWDAPSIQNVSTNVIDRQQATLRSATSNIPPANQSELSGLQPTSILISRLPEHAMRKDGLYDSMTLPSVDCRTSQHMNNDGWIVGPRSELLFWVPAAYRDRLWPDTRLQFVIGKQPLQLDLSQFVHGTSWHECYRPSLPQ